MTLYVQPEIARGDQLKSQTLGISHFNSTGHTVTTLILRKLGLERSATMRPLGGTPEMQAAFEQKHVAGIVTGVKPAAPARALLNAFGAGHSLCHECPCDHPGVSAEKNPDNRGARGLRAYIEAVGAINHDREATLKVLAKYFKRSDPNFLDETYALVTKFVEKTPRVDARNVATVLEFEPVKGVDAETLAPKVIDNSVVDKLVKEGFIEKVFVKTAR